MAGLRERKKQATRAAIHDAALRLFERRGYAGTTIDQIAAAADVSRATVFSYFPSKEDIVFGDAPQAIASLTEALRAGGGTLQAVRAWLGELTGWIEPGLLLQRRLAREVPDVGARRAQLHRELERVVAEALEREWGAGQRLAARLAAGALLAALTVAEDAAAERMERDERPLSSDEVAAFLDAAVAFVESGVAALAR